METVDALKGSYPNLLSPPSDDICYATQNRQTAIKKVAADADLVIVVGSKNSSNSVRLVETAVAHGAGDGRLVDFADEIDEAWLEGVTTVGLTSGASVPEVLVDGVLEWLAAARLGGRGDRPAGRGAHQFSLPKELRRDLRAEAASKSG